MTSLVFIDGHAGTTGLRIRQWLAERRDLNLLTLNDTDRKSAPARRQAMSKADVTVLCLPDAAAKEAGRWALEDGNRIIDASSVHRVADGWTFGLPELSPAQRSAIRTAKRISNTGCYPCAFLLLIRPLVDAGLLPAGTPVSIHALSGYSGGGRGLIEHWESAPAGLEAHPYEAPYALDKVHKHVPEMHRYSGLVQAPQFIPAVGPFACGMRVQIPLHGGLLAEGTTAKAVYEALATRYANETFVELMPYDGPDAGTAHEPPRDEWSFDPTALNGTNLIRLQVVANPAGHLLLVGILDNLGKGASGTAIQCMSLMLGLDEAAGLPRARPQPRRAVA
ncbi:MAG: N-acetyl-gamma-glutamyl-phosphate reductase [Gammaproteobacteria bacterium]|nr:N-acetyl-gamma-glutamyl-phosphate reductase [Gammaproteobacteria bacterium]